MKTSFTLNGKQVSLEVPEDSTLLWVLREHLKLTGTKYGCGIAQCGSCTVHFNGEAARACTIQASLLEGGDVVTIEGLSGQGDDLHPVQKAWIEEQVPQCGYCQSGQIMQAVALLNTNPNPSRDQIKEEMSGILCRCGTYHRIIKAIESASQEI